MAHQIKGKCHGALQKGVVGARSWPRTAKLTGPRAWQGTVDDTGEKPQLKVNHDVGQVSHNVSLLSSS